MVTLALLGIAMLTEIRDARRIQEAPDSRLLSFTEAVEELALATGRTVRYMCISTDRCAALLSGQDVADEVIAHLRRVVIELLDGRHARQAPDVERAMGREPHDFGDHARPGASRGASDVAPAQAASRSLSG